MLPGRLPEVARRVHAMRDGQPARRRLLAGGEVRALRHRQRQLAQGPAHLGRLAFHLLEAVDGFHRHHHGVLDAPGNLAPLDLFLGEVEHRLVGAGFVQQLHRGADRRPELAVAKIALLAEADEQHAVGQRAAHVVQQQGGAKLALHVAAADDFADVAVARAIDQFGRQRQLAIVEHAYDDARAALLLGAAAFYGKFHCDPSSPPRRFVSVTRGAEHYRQISPKKSKFSRRHDFPP